jgi:homoserine kinase type II
MVKDDAGGGRRGLRPTATPELIKSIADRYGFDNPSRIVDLGGSSSLNLLLSDGNRRYVVRVYRSYVTEARLRDLHLVRRALLEGGVPCSAPVPALDGGPWLALDGRLLEVERYVDHDADMDSWGRLESALPVLGQIHTILQDVEVGPAGREPQFANYVEPEEALDRTLRGTRRIRGWDPSPAEAWLADAAEELAHLVAAAEKDLVSELPRQLVHGDFWDNNVYLRDGRVVLVGDFEFMGERARVDDLALTLYFASLEYPEDPVSDDQLGKLRRLVDAYNGGLGAPLTGKERTALALTMARQPLWSIGGWVALLDDEASARRHASGTVGPVEWGLKVVRDLARWQSAFA